MPVYSFFLVLKHLKADEHLHNCQQLSNENKGRETQDATLYV